MREAIRMEALPADVHVVADGDQATAFIDRADADAAAPCPSLILVDLNLPKQDGFDVVRHIRASSKCRNVPVLIVTSSDAPADRKIAAELGASYFRKPPSYSEFLKLGAAMKRLVDQSRSGKRESSEKFD